MRARRAGLLASHLPACRALEPRLHAFAKAHPGAFAGYRIDIATDEQTPARFDVMSIPTVIWLRDGREVARQDGLIRDADLASALSRLTEETTTQRE